MDRRFIAAAACLLFGLIDILGFGMYAKHGDATFAFSPEFAKVTVPNLGLPAATTAYVCGAISIAIGAAAGGRAAGQGGQAGLHRRGPVRVRRGAAVLG